MRTVETWPYCPLHDSYHAVGMTGFRTGPCDNGDTDKQAIVLILRDCGTVENGRSKVYRVVRRY